MVNWKKYKIIERKDYPASSDYEAYVRFTLDGLVEYSDENKKFIDCDAAYFRGWAEGDEIEINIGITKQEKSSKTFDDDVAIRNSSYLETKYEEEKEKREELDKEHQKCLPIRQWLEFENKELKEKIKDLEQQIEQLQSQLQQTQISVPPKENN